MLNSIHHAAIICSDYERSKDFYTRILGIEILAENYRQQRNSYKLDLRLPCGTQIELFSFSNAPARPSFPEALGLRHIAFSVTCIKTCVNYLKENGITVEPIRIDPYTNKQFTFFQDPDGLPLELYQSA